MNGAKPFVLDGLKKLIFFDSGFSKRHAPSILKLPDACRQGIEALPIFRQRGTRSPGGTAGMGATLFTVMRTEAG